MSDFTIEQLEALKEGTTPGPWEASIQAFAENEGGGYSLHAEVADKDGVPLMYAEDGFVFRREPNFTLAASAPELVDALIAEKRAHQRIRTELEAVLDVVKHETWLHDDAGQFPKTVQLGSYVAGQLTRILEADNG